MSLVHAARVSTAEMVLAWAFYGERPGDGLGSALCGAIIRVGDRAKRPEDVTCPACQALVPAEIAKDVARAVQADRALAAATWGEG